MRRLNRRAFVRTSVASGFGIAFLKRAARAAESAIDPPPLDLPITDSHVHFWDPARLEYSWLRGSPIGAPHLPADYWKATSGFKVEKLVFVEAACRRDQAGDEVSWVDKLARQEPRIAGIVAFAPMDDAKVLASAREDFARRPLVKGIRHLVQSEKEVEFCLRPEFVAGVSQLAGSGLAFDIGARHEQLPAVARLVEQCPRVSFALNHLGGPNIKQGTFKPWNEHIRRLAALPNLWCKVSGAATQADWKSWQPDQLKPYVAHVLEAFGFDRVMFGSDWPVCTLACSFRRWVEVLDEFTKDCTRDERERLFSRNARKAYHLGQ